MTKFSLITAEVHRSSANVGKSAICHTENQSPKKETSKSVNFLEGTHEPTYLDLLPPELIVWILSFIKNDYMSVYRCSLTSAKIYETCLQHRELFNELDYHISIQQIGPICKYTDFPEHVQKLKDPGTFPAIPVTSITRVEIPSQHTKNNAWLCFNYMKSPPNPAQATRFRVKKQQNLPSSNDNQIISDSSNPQWEIVNFDDSIYKNYRVVVLDDGSWICLGWKAPAEENPRSYAPLLLQLFEPDGTLRWQREAKQIHGTPNITEFDVLHCSRDNIAIYYYGMLTVVQEVMRRFHLELGLVDVKTSQIYQVGIAQTVYTKSPDSLEPISQVLTLGKITNNKLGAVVNSIHHNTEHTVYIEFPVDFQSKLPQEEATDFSVPCREILNDDFTNYVMEHGLTRHGGTLLTLNQSNEISKLPLVIVHNQTQPKLTRFQLHGICRSEGEIVVCFKNSTSHAPAASLLENSSSGVISPHKDAPYGLWILHFDKEGNVKRNMLIDHFKEDFWLFKSEKDEYYFWKKTKPPILILDFQLERYRAGASHNVNIAIVNSKGELRKDRIRHHMIAPGIDGRALVQSDSSIVFAAKDLEGFFLLSIKFENLKW